MTHKNTGDMDARMLERLVTTSTVAGLSAYTYGSDARSWIDPSYLKVARDEVAKVRAQVGPEVVLCTPGMWMTSTGSSFKLSIRN